MRIVALGLLLTVGLLAVTTHYWVQIPFLKFSLQAGLCRFGPPLAGVYFPSRLKLVDRCRTVSGTVDCLKVAPDGDIHVRLRLDPQFASLLKSANSLQTCPNQPRPNGGWACRQSFPRDRHDLDSIAVPVDTLKPSSS